MIRFSEPPPRVIRRLPGLRTPLRRLAKRRAPLGPLRVNVAGLTLDLAPADNKVDFDVWYKRRFDEAEEYAFLASHMRAGDTFVDVGANIGLYSAAVLAAVPGSRAIAFEPLPHLAARYRQNMALNALSDRTTLIEAAVGPAGTMPLHRSGNAGASSLLPLDGAIGTLEVSVIPLWPALQNSGAIPATLKIDVEGFEDAALMPFFDEAPPNAWPRAIVIETLHRTMWRRDCLLELVKLDYEVERETEENALLVRQTKSE